MEFTIIETARYADFSKLISLAKSKKLGAASLIKVNGPFSDDIDEKPHNKFIEFEIWRLEEGVDVFGIKRSDVLDQLTIYSTSADDPIAMSSSYPAGTFDKTDFSNYPSKVFATHHTISEKNLPTVLTKIAKLYFDFDIDPKVIETLRKVNIDNKFELDI